MPLSPRSLSAVILALSVAGCTEFGVKGPPPSTSTLTARISMNPAFSPAASAVAANLSDFGLAFDRIHLAIRQADDTTKIVLDTIAQFGPDQESLVLDLSVPVDSIGQEFNALLEYLSENTVVFRGSKLVKSYALDGAPPEEGSFTLSFVGPGAKVKTISIAPKPVNIVGEQTVALTVTAVDSSGATTTVPVLFSTSNPEVATVSSAGVVTGSGSRGTATISVTTPTGISDETSASVTPPATDIVLVSGGGQRGTVGAALANPGVVRVIADDSLGVPNVPVIFAAPIGGAVGTASALSDADGYASSTLTLATTAGPQSFSATAEKTVAIPATALAGSPSAAKSTITASPTQITASYQGNGSTITVQSRDQYGNPNTTGGSVVQVKTNLGRFGMVDSLATVTATDAGNGKYTAVLFASNPGTATVSGTLGGAAIGSTASVRVVAGAVSYFNVTGADGGSISNVVVGKPVAIRVVARDGLSNVATGFTGQPVLRVHGSTFGVSDTLFTMPAAVNGVSTASVTFGTPTFESLAFIDASYVSGQTTSTGSSGGFSIAPGAAAYIKASGREVVVNDISAPTNYPAIVVTDVNGGAVPNIPVAFSVQGFDSETQSPGCETRIEGTLTTDATGRIALDANTFAFGPSSAASYSCLVIATASVNGVPLSGSPLSIPIIFSPANQTAWTGLAHDHSWSNPQNWTEGLPTGSFGAFLPTASTLTPAFAPVLSANQAALALEVEDGALLDLGGHTLTVRGTLNGRTAGLITNGTVALNHTEGFNIQGVLPNVTCTGGGTNFYLTGPTQVTGSFANSACGLEMGSATMTIVGDYTQTGTGAIAMRQASNNFTVFGKATFAGSSEAERLSAGTMVFVSSFAQAGIGTSSFMSGGSQRMYMTPTGTSARTLNIDDPAGSPIRWLQLVTSPLSPLTVSSQIFIQDSLLIGSGDAPGHLTFAKGLYPEQNGAISIATRGDTITIGQGTVNARVLGFEAGSIVTLDGTGNLDLTNTDIYFRTGAKVTINVSGTITPPTGSGCVMATGVELTGTNTNAIELLKYYCSSR